ncbi:NYN domain-containing protein [Cellulomonas sp. APG4]|uniref:NYN domain-containing protein n=1 Tax=Cellulomonas sp. APG4 TaxID=1538656 RepID=UPI0013796963|nr:NYN domain-containing protein [Cellulomonas sp. APG4]NCT91769.1 NYN domain-containing protein [Cellulomonas sp. APG4]
MTPRARIALLIDADNASPRGIDVILNELSAAGETSIRRAYGNWTKPSLRGWADLLLERAIRPIQQYDYSARKNASDMALVVDALALHYTEKPEAFAIVSSDGDFTPLVMHLRERGASVYGFGDDKTPAPFKNACSRFLVMDRLEDDAGPAAASAPAGAENRTRAPVPTSHLKQDTALVTLLRRAVKSAADEAGWARVSTVGQHIANQSSLDPRNYGYQKLSALLEATELFVIRDAATSTVAVRDRRDGSATR